MKRVFNFYWHIILMDMAGTSVKCGAKEPERLPLLAPYLHQRHDIVVCIVIFLLSNMPGSSSLSQTHPMTLCNTPESLRAALDTISGHTHVFFDCEGRTLGEAGGKLSLLNLGVVQEEDRGQRPSVFLIDILAFQGLNSHHLVPIFDLMSSETVFKVVFDGRMDASELLHGHGVQLKNVLDLQVADILSREKRGEGIEGQLGRLVGFLRQEEITRNRALYLQVQKINGLNSAMQEHGVGSNAKGCELRFLECGQ
jgi:hypothetical protein